MQLHAFFRGQRYDDVKVVSVEPDGKFTLEGPHGLTMGGCNPNDVLLYDENDQQVYPASLSPPISETALLKAQVEALTARGDFLEDVIAELAMMVL